jgi:cytochrome P450
MNAPAMLRRLEDLPGPRGIPLVGNALQFKPSLMHRKLEEWAGIYGPYYAIRLGRRPILVSGDHQAVAASLRDRPEGFSRTQRLEEIGMEMGLPPGLFGSNGESWRRQRRMVMAAFDPAHVKRYFPAMQKVAARLVGRWQAAAREGRAIDLQADLMRYTVDTIAGLAFGAEVNTLESDGDIIQQHLDKIFPALFRRLFAPFAYWRLVRLPADRALERSMVEVLAAVDRFVAQARERLAADPARRGQPHNLLEAMIVAADAPDSGIEPAQVTGNVLTMLLAGEDTTANTLAWMIDLLWRHRPMLARATEEVRRVAGDAHTIRFEHLAQLEYVEACAHEAMRLKPVAPLLLLQADRDTTIGDVAVRKGTVVINLMRHDSVSDEHVPHAAEFLPERWLADGGPAQAASAAKRIAMPFGAGPRICPGRYLALLEIKLAMAALLGRFDIADVGTPGGRPAAELLAFTMMPVGLRMTLRERR